MKKIKVLSAEEVIKIHDEVLSNSGGFPGVSLHKSLAAALNRAETHSFYEGITDLFEIAAIYCISLAQGHLFNDGNKRTAFSVMYNFLQVNGYDLIAESKNIIDTMLDIAEKKLEIKKMAEWIKKHCYEI